MYHHPLRILTLAALLGLSACTSTNNTNEQPSNDASVSDTQPKESPIETAPRKDYPLDDVLRFNHIQVLGTHNSYHIAPKQGVADWKYTHSPLETQLQKEGVHKARSYGKKCNIMLMRLLRQSTTWGSTRKRW